jgi:hypothetical protein
LSHNFQESSKIAIGKREMPPFMTLPSSRSKHSGSSMRSEKVFPVPVTDDKSNSEESNISGKDSINYVTVNGEKFKVKDMEWKTMAPTNGVNVMKHDGKTWRWCSTCEKWMFHDITKHDFWAVRNLH